jgi:hypothetical protein
MGLDGESREPGGDVTLNGWHHYDQHLIRQAVD